MLHTIKCQCFDTVSCALDIKNGIYIWKKIPLQQYSVVSLLRPSQSCGNGWSTESVFYCQIL